MNEIKESSLGSSSAPLCSWGFDGRRRGAVLHPAVTHDVPQLLITALSDYFSILGGSAYQLLIADVILVSCSIGGGTSSRSTSAAHGAPPSADKLC